MPFLSGRSWAARGAPGVSIGMEYLLLYQTARENHFESGQQVVVNLKTAILEIEFVSKLKLGLMGPLPCNFRAVVTGEECVG